MKTIDQILKIKAVVLYILKAFFHVTMMRNVSLSLAKAIILRLFF